MGTPLRGPAEAPALHDRAIADLSFIRRTMEGASAFTDVPGWGLVVIGATAIGAAVVSAGAGSAAAWFGTWMAEAALAASLGMLLLWRKMRRRARDGAPFSVPARKFLLGLLPAIVAGAVLTFALLDRDSLAAGQPVTALPRALPGLWLLLYGAGVVTAGMNSVRAVPLMGLTLMATGTAALLVPGLAGEWMLAAGFGAVQMGFGLWIARRYGG